MDQASLLRELMNKNKSQPDGASSQDKAGSVAILSTSGVYNMGEFLKPFTRHCAKKTQKKTTLLGVSDRSGLELEDCILERADLEQTKIRLSPGADFVPGSLDILPEVIKNKYLMQNFLRIIEEIEEETERVLYYAGSGMDFNAIKLSLVTNKVVIVVHPTERAFQEACNYIKVFSKTGSSEKAGIIVDTSDYLVYQEQCAKIQEFCGSRFKYNIEPLGYYEMKFISIYNDDYEIFKKFNMGYLTDNKQTKVFSEFVEKIM